MPSQIKVDQITDSSGTLPVDMPNGAKVFGENISPSNGFKNKLINGDFDIWQRGTSQTSGGYRSADRWWFNDVGTTRVASRQTFTLGQTEVPGNPTYYIKDVVSSVSGADNSCSFMQRVERVQTLAGKTATLSFWAKADSSKNIAIEFTQDFGTGGTPSSSVFGIGAQLVALTTTWTKYIITIDVPSVFGKTIGTNGDDWFGVRFWFDAGSNYASRTANLGQQSGIFDIAQVQLEEGVVATPFEQRPIGLELELCQRYYEMMGSTATYMYPRATTSYSVNCYFTWFMKVEKRTSPTVSYTTDGVTGVSVSANKWMVRFVCTATATATIDDLTAEVEL